MIRKYLKPFLLSIIFCFTFLFVQANCELTLPDYMSKIVNYGIQNSGIENNLPTVIRAKEYKKVKLFLDTSDQKDLDKVYTKITKKSNDYDKYKEKYDILEKENIYVLNDSTKNSKAIIEKIDVAVGKSEIIVYGLENQDNLKDQKLFKLNAKDSLGSSSKSAKTSMMNANSQQMGQMGNSSKLNKKMDMFTVLSNMPKKELNKTRESITKSFKDIPDTSISQIAGKYIKDEYKKCGLDIKKVQSDYIWNIGFKMLLISLLGTTCAILVGLLASRAGAGVARMMRKDVFEKVEHFSNSEFNKFSLASLITRTTNDVTQVQMATTMSLRLLLFAPIMGTLAIIKALQSSVSMSWVIALAVIVILCFMGLIFSFVLPKFTLIQKLTDKLNLVARENLSGLMVIRAFGTEDFEEERFDNVNDSLTRANLFVNRAMIMLMPFMMLVMNGVQLLIVWVGAGQIEASNLQVGDMMAFIQYSMQIIMSFLFITMMFVMLPRAKVSADRINQVLSTQITLTDPKAEKEFKKVEEGKVEFKNVCFAYPGASEYILHDISFTANKGETTAIVGSTGSGKSTLIQLIPRLFETTKGEVLVNGVNVKDVTQEHLRDSIGYIPQKGILFKGTIKSNLEYGLENPSEDEIKRALDISQSSEFVNTLEEGINSPISSGGTNVSGGQRQRLSIARAIIKNSKINIFDDSFSALDFKTDKSLRTALRDNMSDSTMIIVAQRISTIMDAEKIIVLNEGEIVGEGTHSELINSCEVYREIALSQLSEEEVMNHGK